MKILFIVDIYEKHIVKTKIQKEMLKKYKKTQKFWQNSLRILRKRVGHLGV